MLDEILQVGRVRSVRRPGESVVAAGQHAHAALVHCLHRLGGRGELFFVPQLARFRGRNAVRRPFLQQLEDHRQSRSDEDLVLVRLQQIECFVVGVAGVVNDLAAEPHCLLD